MTFAMMFERALDVACAVSEFFKGDKEKTRLWLNTPNPLLGYWRPIEMCDDERRLKRLERFVCEQLAENVPPLVKLSDDSTLREIWQRLTAEQQEKAFFLFWGIVEFYAGEDTWFATTIIADPPAGAIVTDIRRSALGRPAPGGRARLAFQWVLNMFGRVAAGRPS